MPAPKTRLLASLCSLLAGAACVPPRAPAAADAGASGPALLHINEVMARNQTTIGDALGEFDDWLELYNSTDIDVALAGYTLADSAALPAAFPEGALVPAKGFLLVFADDVVAQSSVGEPHLPFKLAGAGEALTLRHGNDIVDELVFVALKVDASFGRVPDGSETSALLALATPGEANSDAAAGEGEGEGEGECVPPFAVAPTLVINEALLEDTSGFLNDQSEASAWIELFNTGADPVTLEGLLLSDDPAFDNAWALAAQAPLAAGAYLVVFADGDAAASALHTSFALAATDVSVILADTCHTILQTLPLIGADVNTSIGLLPNGDPASPAVHASPTPGAANLP